MSSILIKGVIRNGRVEVAEPINLPDGSEVTITGHAHGKFLGFADNDRPMTPERKRGQVNPRAARGSLTAR